MLVRVGQPFRKQYFRGDLRFEPSNFLKRLREKIGVFFLETHNI